MCPFFTITITITKVNINIGKILQKCIAKNKFSGARIYIWIFADRFIFNLFIVICITVLNIYIIHFYLAIGKNMRSFTVCVSRVCL